MVVPDRTEEERRLADAAKIDGALHALRVENDAITREALIADRVPGEEKIKALVERRLGSEEADGGAPRRTFRLRLLTAAAAVAVAVLVARLRIPDDPGGARLTPAGISDAALDTSIDLIDPTSHAGVADSFLWSLSDDDGPEWTYIVVATDSNTGKVVRISSTTPTRCRAAIRPESPIRQWRSWSWRVECRTELGERRESRVVELE